MTLRAGGTLRIVPRHDLTPMEISGIEDNLYAHNRVATGKEDGQWLGFALLAADGAMFGTVAGYTWAGMAELKQMWVDAAYRGQGYGRALLDAAIAEAAARGATRIWVTSYSFQAPGLYERAGFQRMAELPDWPPGHSNVIFCKVLA